MTLFFGKANVFKAMSEPRAQSSDRITLLVFKDNLASRTFQVPLGWISRLGALATLLAVIFLTTLFLSVKYYRASRLGDPSRVRELENDLADLRTAHGQLQERLAKAPTAPAQEESQESPLAPGEEPAPLISFSKARLFTAVAPPAAGAPENLVSETELPFALKDARVQWQGNTLRASYNIQFTRASGGSQQGRIVMLARGPGAIYAYPPQVLQPAGAETLIAPLRGEYFSVSRFRAVRADFGPIADRASVREVEILLFDTDAKLIAHRRLPVDGNGKSPETAPAKTEPKTAAPAAPTSNASSPQQQQNAPQAPAAGSPGETAP